MSPAHGGPALRARGLRKTFGDNVAVDSIDLEIPRGVIFGVVGPNGAGKTTMIEMAAGLLRPDRGEVAVAGVDSWKDPLEMKTRLGLLADGLPVFDRLTGAEYLGFLGALRGMNKDTIDRRAQELLTVLGLSEAAGRRIVDYSAGMTKKILLAGSLIHNPEVLILDEPLEAVDPVSGRQIQQILREYAAAGGTVVISSHVMEIVEGLCSHVAIIVDGRVHAAGTVEEVAAGRSLTDVFVEAVGGEIASGSLSWLGRGDDE